MKTNFPRKYQLNFMERLSNMNPKENNSMYIYGVKFPKRLFVGGLPEKVTAADLANFFERFGTVIEAKIVLNNKGNSKGYGFVTFYSPEDVGNVMKSGQIYMHGNRLNLGPAVRKQKPDVEGEAIVLVTDREKRQQHRNS
ncbi:protein boule-like [Clytia hemisphaerica]|uniref:Boule-like 1e n=1 Tax=Clytia hemisphaerica TaxID=252671 RepID=A0A0P0ET67_9CNID|nr:boule-like 1e [Clytia hemisphaerica]